MILDSKRCFNFEGIAEPQVTVSVPKDFWCLLLSKFSVYYSIKNLHMLYHVMKNYDENHQIYKIILLGMWFFIVLVPPESLGELQFFSVKNDVKHFLRKLFSLVVL